MKKLIITSAIILLILTLTNSVHAVSFSLQTMQGNSEIWLDENTTNFQITQFKSSFWFTGMTMENHTATGFTVHRAGDNIPVPEPATMFLFGSGLLCLAIFRKKSKKGQKKT